ncbi:MAG TPA: elongation factor G [Bacteroidales bacterium]|nr:elongation factor G [Bacteroidales bacterium]
MKVYQTNEIRNIALVGGAKAGKTTLAECMLFEGGLISRRGSVDDKNTVSDYRQIELERQNSVSSTVMYAEYKGKKINIIDCPGMDDFVGEVVAALKVADTALMVINAQNGVEVGAEIAWRYTTRDEKPVIFVVNHLEHDNSNFDETLRQLTAQFGPKVTLAQYPMNPGASFNAIIDLVKMKMLKFPANGGAPEVLDIPDAERAKAEDLQARLIENAAEADEALMEKFFENGTLTEEELHVGLEKGIANRDIYPVFCTNAKHNMGVGVLMEFIASAAPAPHSVTPLRTTGGKEIRCDAAAGFVALVFKTSIESHIGEISFFKVLSGELTEALDVNNPRRDNKERISQIFSIWGKNRQKVDKMVAGDIGATIKLKDTATNDTLCGLKNAEDVVAPIVFPNPKISMAARAKNTADEEKLAGALHEIHRMDPTLKVEMSKELKQMIVSGQGELHLNFVKWHVETLDKVPMEYFAPRIPYRETITKSAKSMYRHKKQSGGSGQFGEVHMMIHPYVEGMDPQKEFPIRGTEEVPLSWGGKLLLNNCIVGGAIDARFMPAIMKGLMEKMESGPLTGSYARDIVVNIYDGKMHPVDSNEISFKLASRNAFREAFKNAGPKILEPIYDVEVIVPEDRMGDVMTDLQGRRAVILGMESEGTYQKIKARVPLAEMNRYSTSLSSITSGRAMYSLAFAEYAQVPGDVQDKLLKEYEDQQEEED